ncbi:hypothetical protein GCM10023114_20000 [Mycolicibacterium sediminis]|uniref:TetR family transcriptional regulator n=1 Tax=Mycolicibacterium sediminis TaxID=1286180 RepID=A0A7I7QQ20_9MYCO|nr:hypothetical protein MSEDJ_25690 [Mycolicibacterium sediminis]
MPPEIDTSARLTEIAEATLEIAREEGPGSVTIRAVAARMGRSTTVVTKYVPSRSALLVNAVSHVRSGWDAAVAEVLDRKSGMDRLRALMDWTLDTEDYDDAARRLWHEILAKEEPDSDQWGALVDEAHDDHASIVATIEESAIDAPPWLADVLFLVSRGFFVSTVKDPEDWSGDRARVAVNAMLDDLVAPGVTRSRRAKGQGNAG